MKKTLTFAILTALLLTVIGCTASKPEPDGEILLPEPENELSLYGYNCIIAQKYPETEPFRYKPDTLYSELVMKRIAEIDKNYESTTEFYIDTSDEYLRNTIASVASGQYLAELAVTHQPSYLVYADVLTPLTEVKDVLDYENSEKYGSAGLLEIGMKESVPYTVCPVLWPEKFSSYCYSMICVNENIIAENNLTDPREYVENGTWKWDKFLEILPSYTIDEGDGHVVKAFGSTWNILQVAAFTNGMTYVMDQNGNRISGLNSKEFAETADFYSKLTNDYKDNIKLMTGYEAGVTAYLNNDIILYQTSYAHLVQSIAYEAENFGTIPFPCGPSQQYGVWPNCISDFDSIGIYANADSPEDAAVYISLLLEPLEGFETDEERRAAMNNLLYTDSDIDYYMTHLNNTHFNYWTSDMNTVWDNMASKIATGSSVAEITDSYSTKYEAALDKYASDNFEYMNSHK